MNTSRDFTNVLNWILDNLIPPVIRDSKFFMYPLFWVLFKRKAKLFMDFKNDVSSFSENQIHDYYIELADVHLDRATDLNNKTIDYILNNIYGETVLDIACGRGYLANKIVAELNHIVTGIDFIINDNIIDPHSNNPQFIEGNVEKIPFPDNSFDTVICTHTLEHVFNIQQGISELRRVCKKKLIVVLPKQREYEYTFDLHIHFFPYRFSVLNVMNNRRGHCFCLNNDWVYVEEKK